MLDNAVMESFFHIMKAEMMDEHFENKGSIISVVGKTTVEIIELFECRQKVP